MRDPNKHIREILERFGEDFDTQTWAVPGGKSRAILHPCVERMVAKAGIRFMAPEIVSADPNNVVIIVHGEMNVPEDNNGVIKVWSFGEAAPKNNKNAYVYSMAEKRGKGRVALKLLGLHGLLHDETETFVEEERTARPAGNGSVEKPKSARQAKKDGDWERLTGAISAAKDVGLAELLLWPTLERHAISGLRTDWQEEIVEAWSLAFETALAAECQNLAQVRAFGREYTPAIEGMPAAFTEACDRLIAAALTHHKRSAQPQEVA